VPTRRSDGDEQPTLDDVVRELRKGLDGIAGEFTAAFEKWQEEAEYRFDKELGKQLAKHPELYADLKRGYRQLRKGMDNVARDLGLR
jgi:hypothetical protein